jgi:hypothetical protein
LYKTLIRPVLLYGCETWTINRYNEEKIPIFERKVLRKIYGPILIMEDGELDKTMNSTSFLVNLTSSG